MTTVPKLLNIEAFKKLIGELGKADLGPYSKDLGGLVEKYGLMAELLEELQTLDKEEDIQVVNKRIEQCRGECLEAIKGFLAKFNTNYEETAEYYNNPTNFNQKEWEELQTIRHKVEGTTVTTQPSPMILSKQVKNKKE